MKKSTFALALAATLLSSSGFAQQTNNTTKTHPPRPPANDHFAWGPAVGGLVLLGVVVGIVAGTAASSPNTFSH